MQIRFAVKIPPIPLFNPQMAQGLIAREVGQELTAILDDRAKTARQEANVGGTGLLRGTIATSVTRGTDASQLVRGQLATGAQAPYAQDYADGTPPGRWIKDVAPLKLWAQKVIGDAQAAYPVRWAIFRRGTLGHPRFRAAFQLDASEVQRRVQAVMDRVAQLLQGGR